MSRVLFLIRRLNSILLLCGATVFPAMSGAEPPREARIGVDQAAPYQSWVPGHGPMGFTVDVLSAAARKCGIHLKWLNCPEGPMKALANGKVDMWPLLGVPIAQKMGVYLAKPWLQNEYTSFGDARTRISSAPRPIGAARRLVS